jgi:hypothetical protein
MTTVTTGEPRVWTEDIKYTSGELHLDGGSFNRWVDEFLEPLPIADGWELDKKYPLAKDSDFYFVVRPFETTRMANPFEGCGFPTFLLPDAEKVPVTNTLMMNRNGATRGKVSFDTVVNIPIVAERRRKNGRIVEHSTWMSLTPSEVWSQRSMIRKARGNVLIGGLGMGWMLRRVLERKQVKSVTVYEREQAIIDTFGAPILDLFPDKKIKFVLDDAYNAKVKRFDSVLFDIWEGQGDHVYDREWTKIKKTHDNAHAWK